MSAKTMNEIPKLADVPQTQNNQAVTAPPVVAGQAQEATTPQLFPNEFSSRTFQAIARDLYKPVPLKFISTRKQGGALIAYISWDNAVKLFEHYAIGYNYEIKASQIIYRGDQPFAIQMTVRVTIIAEDGIFYREATGYEEFDLDGKSYGDVSSNCESMALRRCLAKFGLGLYLYDDKHPQFVEINKRDAFKLQGQGGRY